LPSIQQNLKMFNLLLTQLLYLTLTFRRYIQLNCFIF
jgi:hypothetical protein